MCNMHGKGLPLVAWRLKTETHYDEFAIARHLRSRGWIVPAYTMAPHAESIKLLRVVVREDFSRHRCETLVRDLKDAVDFLDKTPAAVIQHLAKATKTNTNSSHRSVKVKHHHEEHSLQAKHGKTHGVC